MNGHASARGGGGDAAPYVKRSTLDWVCADCKFNNYAYKDVCGRCRAPKPASVGAVEGSAWTEVLDASTRQLYYWNKATQETTWVRPLELGAAPHATGYFGRGLAGVDAQSLLQAKNSEWLRRPARKQTDCDPSKLQRAEGANEFNIWYGRYHGEHWRGGLGREPAPFRCYPEFDAGFTKASGGDAYFCLHFAHGACFRGADCPFFHHIPVAADDGRLDPTRDIFGRQRFASHRDDMGGVGSFQADCRTLYVGHIVRREPLALPSAGSKRGAAGGDGKSTAAGAGGGEAEAVEDTSTEAAVRRAFSVWGEVENVNFISRLGCAFVRYRCRSSTEFAREAMGNQTLLPDPARMPGADGSAAKPPPKGKDKDAEATAIEVLNVRWAYDDPNPAARNAALQADVDAVLATAAMREAAGPMVGPSPGPAALPPLQPQSQSQQLALQQAGAGGPAAATGQLQSWGAPPPGYQWPWQQQLLQQQPGAYGGYNTPAATAEGAAAAAPRLGGYTGVWMPSGAPEPVRGPVLMPPAAAAASWAVFPSGGAPCASAYSAAAAAAFAAQCGAPAFVALDAAARGSRPDCASAAASELQPHPQGAAAGAGESVPAADVAADGEDSAVGLGHKRPRPHDEPAASEHASST